MQATVTTPRPTSHATWLVLGSLLAGAAIVYGTWSVVSAVAFDRFDRHVSFAGAVRVVEVHASAGGVRIIGRDQPGAEVDTHVIRGLTEPRREASLVGGRLVIHNACRGWVSTYCTVTSTVRVPRGVTVVVRASGGGARIRGISGPLDVESSGGGVRVEGASGDLRLRSSGGGITATGLTSATVDADASGGGVELGFARPPVVVRGSSSGGGVTVVVPRDRTAYRIDATSSGGGTHTDVRTDPASRRRIDVSSSGGGVTVRYPG